MRPPTGPCCPVSNVLSARFLTLEPLPSFGDPCTHVPTGGAAHSIKRVHGRPVFYSITSSAVTSRCDVHQGQAPWRLEVDSRLEPYRSLVTMQSRPMLVRCA